MYYNKKILMAILYFSPELIFSEITWWQMEPSDHLGGRACGFLK